MCGRFTLTLPDFRLLAEIFGVPPDPALEGVYRPRFNIAPTDEHWIIVNDPEGRRIVKSRWGFQPSWADPKINPVGQINARAETVAEKPMFRSAFLGKRCVIPADGFYEWTGPRGAKKPFWFHRKGGGLIPFAGLYTENTFAILTRQANSDVSSIDDRMPVILDPPQVDSWLSEDAKSTDGRQALDRLLHPSSPGALMTRSVSTRVNSGRVDDPLCIVPEP